MNPRRGATAIVGTGEVPTGRFPDQGAISFALDAARLAIRDAGIDKDEIDFVIPTTAVFSFQFSNELTTCRLVEELGLRNVGANATVFSGGSSSTTLVAGVKYLFRVTDSDVFLCFAATCAAGGEKFPMGTVMLLRASADQTTISCRSSASTGDVIFTSVQ